MRSKLLKRIICFCTIFALCIPVVNAKAENPVVQTMYTADPSPLVVGDTLYLYTTHDERRSTGSSEWSFMNDWRCFSTTDMVNWTDHGQIAHAKTFDKESNSQDNWRAWAQQVVEMPIYEDGEWVKKYFLFAPFNGTKIDVAVADSPTGPFVDATPGKYLIDGGWGGGNIDPTVYIEDHGNPEDYENYDVYLYWGNPYFRYCKLTNDLLDVDPDTDGDGEISDWENQLDSRFDKSDNRILGEVRPGIHSFDTLGDAGYESFGVPSQGVSTTGKYPTEPESEARKRSAFEEGPWVYKHADGNPDTDDYFLVFVGGRTPGETVEYSTAPTPIGPWTYRGFLMARENGYSCIHPGVAEFKGKNYMFYLNEMLVGGTGSDRSVCVKEFSYDENNLIVKETPDDVKAYFVQGMESTVKGTPYYSVDPVGTLDPYKLNQAETICWESNLNGAEGGFNGTGLGVKTKSISEYYEIDEVTGIEAFWQSAYYNGVAVYDIDNDDYIKVREVDFGDKGPIGFNATVACGEGLPPVNTTVDSNGIMIDNPDADTVGGTIELWIDYDDFDNAKCIGTIEVSDTGGTNTYKTLHMDITEKVTGVHDLHFIFKGEDGAKLFNFDSWQFEKEPEPEPTPTQDIPSVTPNPQVTPPAQNPVVTPAVNNPVVTNLAKAKIKTLKKKGKNVKISVKKVKGADGYQVSVATKKKGKYKIKLNIKSPKASGMIKKLKKGKTYYVKVRAYANTDSKKIYGKYSNIKKIKL
ncbi:MAG: family 43 glycosylhydrolase [Lachnospiraceae bacterium]|jgi:arabinoxylan arabinofuranohydrolase